MKNQNDKMFEGDFGKYRRYIIKAGSNIYSKLLKDGWTINCNTFNVEGSTVSSKRAHFYDKIMCLSITKGDKKIFTEVKKCLSDTDDPIFMYYLALYRVWHKLKKYDR